MEKTKTPEYLHPGHEVGIVAPAGKIDPHKIAPALNVIESWGLKMHKGPNFHKSHGYFAGTDEQRLTDLQQMLDSSSIKAIFCLRGGYGTTRIIDRVNLERLQQYPKWIVGFSDITVLHLKIARYNMESVHGIMPVNFNPEKSLSSVESLRDFLFGQLNHITWNGNSNNIQGNAEGHLIGGNLSILSDSLGTATAPDNREKILFFEEVDEYLYKIDRMLVHLQRSKVFENTRGVLIGHFTTVKDTTTPFGQSLEELILEKFRPLNIPVAFGLPSGHDYPNLPMPHNRKVQLMVTEDNVKLTF